MHLKNFSLYAPKGKWGLTPAYDLVNVALVNPRDDEDKEMYDKYYAVMDNKHFPQKSFVKFAKISITEQSL